MYTFRETYACQIGGPQIRLEGRFFICRKQLVLDFLNTRHVQHGETLELLPDFAALRHWVQAADLLTPKEIRKIQVQSGNTAKAPQSLRHVYELRERLRAPQAL